MSKPADTPVRVRITITETTTYTRVVEMPRADLQRLQVQAQDDDPEARADVAEAMFSFYVDRVDDQVVDQALVTQATLEELPPLPQGGPCAATADGGE